MSRRTPLGLGLALWRCDRGTVFLLPLHLPLGLPSGYVKIAIDKCTNIAHRHSWCTYERCWFSSDFPVRKLLVYQRLPQDWLTNRRGAAPVFSTVTCWFIPVSKSVIILVTSGVSLFSPFITRVITYLVSGMNHQVVLFFACSLPLSGQIHSFLTRAERKSWLTITRLTRCWWVQIPSGKLT